MASLENAGLKTRLMQCGAVSVLSVFLTAAAFEASAQQVVPGTSSNCPITAGEAVCEGDLEDGITSTPGDPAYDTLTITNPATPIAPPGYFGIGVVRNTDTTVNIADDVVINVFDDPNIAGTDIPASRPASNKTFPIWLRANIIKAKTTAPTTKIVQIANVRMTFIPSTSLGLACRTSYFHYIEQLKCDHA